jgi:hypothetical protein
MAIIDPYTQLRGTGALDSNPVNYTSLQSFLDAPKYIDAFSQAFDIGSKYPHNISPTSKYDKQGISSDVRHTLGSAAGKEAIIDWSSANLGIDPYGKFANVIGNVGITGATALEEIPDAWGSFKQALGEKDYGAITSGGIFAQPWEDVQANLNAWGIPYGASLEEKTAAGLPTYDEFWGGDTLSVRDKINAFRLKKQQLMNQKIQQQKKMIGMPEHLTHTPPTPTPKYSGPITHDFDPKQDTGRRPDKPGGFTDPGKGSYGPHMAYGGRVSYFDGGLASLWLR